MNGVNFEEVVKAAREADEWGLIVENGVVYFGTMNGGGLIKLSSGEGKNIIHAQFEFQCASGGCGWIFSPGSICVPIRGIDMDLYGEFLKRCSIILKAISEFLSS